MVDQFVLGLKMYRAIAIDVGTKDPFLTTNTQLDQALTRLGVIHNFESYDGDQREPHHRALCCEGTAVLFRESGGSLHHRGRAGK